MQPKEVKKCVEKAQLIASTIGESTVLICIYYDNDSVPKPVIQTIFVIGVDVGIHYDIIEIRYKHPNGKEGFTVLLDEKHIWTRDMSMVPAVIEGLKEKIKELVLRDLDDAFDFVRLVGDK